MKPDLPQHMEAVEPCNSVVVAASAGTGKTYLLVSRLLRLLLDGVDPARLLAITFTRKAAGEMRERLLARLHQLAVCAPAELDAALRELGVTPDPARRSAARRCHHQLLLHEQGPRIQTFHAFCVDLLKRFPLDAAVPAGFTIAESTELLLQEAWDDLFARATHAPDSPMAASLQNLFESYGTLDSTRRALYSFVEHRGDWWPYTHGQADPVSYACEHAADLLAEQAGADAWPDAQSRDALARYATLLEEHGNKSDLQAATTVRAFLDAPATQSCTPLVPLFFTAKDKPRARQVTRTAEQRLGIDRANELVDLHEVLLQQVQTQRNVFTTRRYAELTYDWLSAGNALLQEYQSLKRRRRTLDFSDLEWQSLRLLHDTADTAWVQFKLDQRIDHVLIDEFQDTNPTQWQLLLPLLEEIVAHGDSERSLFIVGDKKQSIYGFRRADPALQDTAADWLTERTDAVTVDLDRSYRSAGPLMQALNRVFTGRASQLEDYHTHDTHLHTWGRVEVLPIVVRDPPTGTVSEGLRDPLSEPPPERGVSVHQHEGNLIAAHIHELMRRRILIDDGGEQRPLRYGDIMLLLRSRTHVTDYERALITAGIPFMSTDFGTLLDALEIRDVVALLETLAAPFNDVALAQVLRSPMFAADHDMLQLLALSEAGSTWFERLQGVASNFDGAHPLVRAATLLPRWRTLLGRLPTHDLLHHIFHEGEVIARYRLAFPEPLDTRSTRNLSRLLELALEVDSGRYPSPHSFVAHLHALRETQRDAPSEPPQQLRDRLRLMTIHAAKGLEAPVVYLADAASVARAGDTHQALVDWPSRSALPRHFLPGTAKQNRPAVIADLHERLDAHRQREEFNLLYVAMTRARQFLVLSATQTREQSTDNWYDLVHERLQMIGAEQADRRLTFGDTPLVDPQPAPEETTDETLPKPDLPRPARLRPRAAPARPSDREVRPATAGADTEGLARGQLLHRLLEALSGPQEHEALDVIRREHALDNAALNALLDEAQRVMQDPALRRYFDQTGYEQAWNEVPISYYDAGGALVSGVIDRLVKFPTSLTIIDYKTHQVSHRSALNAATNFAGQLQAYAHGVRRIWPHQPVQTLVLFTALPLAVDVTPSDGEQLALFKDTPR